MKRFTSTLITFCTSLLLLLLAATSPAVAEEDSSAQANNPLAELTAVSLHNYYIGELTETDESANQFIFRFGKPFTVGSSNWIIRASLPINSFPIGAGGSKETSIGDLNIFGAYLFDTGDPKLSFGIGPQLTVPTAGNGNLGSEKWSAGLANVFFNGRSSTLQYGYLLTWQGSFAGEDHREDVSLAALQPFIFYQLGHGNYLRFASVWTYNLDNNNYSIPMGVGFGKVFKKKNTVFNLFVEPQFSVADKGPGQPDWQVFIGFNMQFLN